MQIDNHKQRALNIKDAFEIMHRENIKGKSVLLIDDIATTGSTIIECAKILKKAGAEKVHAVVIARRENIDRSS
jgi:predicted amidophosphoribosyltransferase